LQLLRLYNRPVLRAFERSAHLKLLVFAFGRYKIRRSGVPFGVFLTRYQIGKVIKSGLFASQRTGTEAAVKRKQVFERPEANSKGPCSSDWSESERQRKWIAGWKDELRNPGPAAYRQVDVRNELIIESRLKKRTPWSRESRVLGSSRYRAKA